MYADFLCLFLEQVILNRVVGEDPGHNNAKPDDQTYKLAFKDPKAASPKQKWWMYFLKHDTWLDEMILESELKSGTNNQISELEESDEAAIPNVFIESYYVLST